MRVGRRLPFIPEIGRRCCHSFRQSPQLSKVSRRPTSLRTPHHGTVHLYSSLATASSANSISAVSPNLATTPQVISHSTTPVYVPTKSAQDFEIQLSPEQSRLVNLLMTGVNVFFTGKAGTGKSLVLREFIKMARSAGKKVAVTVGWINFIAGKHEF
ncbi:hypothetical protein DFS34DRAFT_234433 [Phlyctochytrium arcticum]|nr:hypothetical protein DFS34DRAFT_234433 [Phlyctochytrium arcticum]